MEDDWIRYRNPPWLLPFVSLQRAHVALWPSWTPCTKPWLAVSSYRETPQHQHPRLLHTQTPSSSPAELTGPALGHRGHHRHHQTRFDHNQTDQPPWDYTGRHWTNHHGHPDYHQSRLHDQWPLLDTLHKWSDSCHSLRTLAAKALSSTGSGSCPFLGPLTFSQNPHIESLKLLDQPEPETVALILGTVRSTFQNLCPRVLRFPPAALSSSTITPAE